jgi:ABC-2 type transport system permease protein/lipopolysaccharide transport system permease protein
LETVNFLFIFISLLILGIAFRQITFTTAYIFLVLPIILAILLLIGEVCIIGIMTVNFRDLAFIVPVVMQTLFFLTPVYYPITMMPARLQQIIGYNPLYWYVELFRKPIYEGTLPPWHFTAACSVLSVSLCIFGLWILKKYDNKIVFRL